MRRAAERLEPQRRRWVEALAASLGDAAALALADELTVDPARAFVLDDSAQVPPDDGEALESPTEELLIDTLQVMRERSPLGRRLMSEVQREMESLRGLDRLRRIQ